MFRRLYIETPSIQKMAEVNLYNSIDKKYLDNDTNVNKNPYMPQHPSLSIICGQTGAGKSNTAVYCAVESKIYEYIIIFKGSQTADPLYDQLADKNKGRVFVEYDITKFRPDIIRKLGEVGPVLVIFDDFITAPKKWRDTIDNFSISCRKDNVSVYLLIQSWFALSKLVRIQSRMIILKRNCRITDLKLILNDVGGFAVDGVPITNRMLEALYLEATNDPRKEPNTRSLIIDRDNPQQDMRIRAGFNNPLDIQKVFGRAVVASQKK